MTFIVPFDGTALSQSALARASELSSVLDESVTAVTVIPTGNASYTQDRGWIEPGEQFDGDAGSIVTSISSVGGAVAAGSGYDVVIIPG